MRPAAPVKMTSGMNTSIVRLIATRGRFLRVRLTAAASTRNYLEPFQILASAAADPGSRGRGGRFLAWVGGQKARVWECVPRPTGVAPPPHLTAIKGYDEGYLFRLEPNL